MKFQRFVAVERGDEARQSKKFRGARRAMSLERERAKRLNRVSRRDVVRADEATQ